MTTLRGHEFFSGANPNPENLITIQVLYITGAKGILVRLFVEYEVLTDTIWVLRRKEVPTLWINRIGVITPAQYPSLHLVDSQEFIQSHTGWAYEAVKDTIYSEAPSANLRLKDARFEVLLIDAYLYNYYSVVNGFSDQLSLRTDKPNYSNIVGGLGLFGSCSVDSIVVPL